MGVGMPLAVVQSAVGTLGLAHTPVVAALLRLVLRMEAVVVTAELVVKLIR